MIGVVQEETLRHRAAFDYYYSLGNVRSIAKVADQFQVSPMSVKRWSKSFDWKTRLKSRDTEISAKLDELTNSAVLDQRTQVVNIVNKLIEASIVKLPDGSLAPAFPVESVQDFEKVVKLYLLLNNEPTDRTENVNTDAREIILARLSRLQSAGTESRN